MHKYIHVRKRRVTKIRAVWHGRTQQLISGNVGSDGWQNGKSSEPHTRVLEALAGMLTWSFQVAVRMLCLWSRLIIRRFACMESELMNSEEQVTSAWA